MTKRKVFTSAQPAEHKRQPVAKRLKLGLQFFADNNGGGEGAGNNQSTGDNDPPGGGTGDGSGSGTGDGTGKGDGDGDPEGDDLPLDLKQLMADYPEIKAQVDKEKERAVKRRFRNKDKDPDPNKKPPGDNNGGGDDETGKWRSKAEQLENKAKEYAFAAHVANEGLNPKLLKALAANEVRNLQLNDDGDLDPDDVEDVLDHLKAEFPDVFKTTAADPNNPPPPPAKKKHFNSGPTTQRTNEQNQQETDIRKDMEARLADMKKRNMI